MRREEEGGEERAREGGRMLGKEEGGEEGAREGGGERGLGKEEG